MLYLIDKYIEQYPYRQIPELLRFEECSENLHEMTLAEVNAEVATWKAVLPVTAENTKRKIAQYLEWLSAQGEVVCFDVSKIEIPTKEKTDEYVIYSTNDIHRYYDVFFMAIEQYATAHGTNVNNQIFQMTHAAGVLAFYGLTDKQILDLELSDIQADGVRGYDLPLTKEDIDVLLRYKNLTVYTNGTTLKGTKYIRNNKIEATIDTYFLNRPLSKANVDEKYSYLKALLKTSQLNLFGKFNRAYNEEKRRNEELVVRGKTPQWFIDIIQASENWVGKRKKEYIAYRYNRDHKNEAVTAKLEAIEAEIAKLNQEAEELRKQMF